MQRSEFSYELPEALIAARPLPDRAGSRLLCLDGSSGDTTDKHFTDFPALLRPRDLLVLNDTRVINARLYAAKSTGGACEILIERITAPMEAIAFVRASKTPRSGQELTLEDGSKATVTGRAGTLFELTFENPVAETLERIGHVPLPPYINRADEPKDLERYQTVYAEKPGAVAAPTAGLHFDHGTLENIRASGVAVSHITLHVGAGTFEPVRTDDLDAHRMHSERVTVSAETIAEIEAARERSGRVVAVGTTVVRALESAAVSGALAPLDDETTLFIRPGYRFRVVDCLLTNFHLPESTLLMLVCAFGGYEHVMRAYRHAVQAHYRFFSYGDAMFLTAAPVGQAARGAA